MEYEFGVGLLVPLLSSVTAISHIKVLKKPHVAKVVKKFIEESKIQIMNWLLQSPDLNLIKNLWFEVKQSVRHKPKPNNLDELDILLIKSISDHVAACLETRREPTKY
ncbi:5606_t:CDS:2 [Scutellospora calospora]|uniref:5606_t:CDS:1 n=1 Tax=Scutellospora calospora TaxID=85575 RepID=A0ACA9KCL8_9GLOM|nr:5606_t:CDS:2 [Scutellospora calospora]